MVQFLNNPRNKASLLRVSKGQEVFSFTHSIVNRMPGIMLDSIQKILEEMRPMWFQQSHCGRAPMCLCACLLGLGSAQPTWSCLLAPNLCPLTVCHLAVGLTGLSLVYQPNTYQADRATPRCLPHSDVPYHQGLTRSSLLACEAEGNWLCTL